MTCSNTFSFKKQKIVFNYTGLLEKRDTVRKDLTRRNYYCNKFTKMPNLTVTIYYESIIWHELFTNKSIFWKKIENKKKMVFDVYHDVCVKKWLIFFKTIQQSRRVTRICFNEMPGCFFELNSISIGYDMCFGVHSVFDLRVSKQRGFSRSMRGTTTCVVKCDLFKSFVLLCVRIFF